MALTSWVSLVAATGLPVRTMQPLEIFAVAKQIIDDAWLTKRCEPFVTKGVLPSGTREKILQGCSPTELQELRARILR